MKADLFTKEIIVNAYECDAENRMTPGALLRHAQQIASDQCEVVGQSAETLHQAHCAYLLAKTAMELRAPIRAGMRITIATMPSAPQRAVYHRCTTFADETGAVLCAIDGRWILVDTQTKRILRRPPEGLPMPFTKEPAFELPLTMPRVEAAPCAEETAGYTRCDIHHHLNNTRYADIILDHLPVERLAARAPAHLAIVYHSEIPMGTRFSLLRAATEPDAWYFCGMDGETGKKYFEASVTLR